VLVDIPLVLLVDPSLGHLVLLANFLEQENAAVWFKNVISHSFNLLARSLKISFGAFSMN